jgi:hypothetical protein
MRPSDPFDGRPCNKMLQGMPGAEHAQMHRLSHAALPGSNVNRPGMLNRDETRMQRACEGWLPRS